jgi:hypothetical protein
MKFLEILSLKNLLDVSRPWEMIINGLAYAGTVCRECGPWMFAGLIGRPSIAGKLRVTCILTGCAGTAFILFVIYRVGGEETPRTLKVFLFVAHLIFWPMLLIAFFRCHKIHKAWLAWAKGK